MNNKEYRKQLNYKIKQDLLSKKFLNFTVEERSFVDCCNTYVLYYHRVRYMKMYIS